MPVPHFCEVCKKQLPSRNKLFQHIKESGHAALKHQTPGVGGATQLQQGQGRGTSGSLLENRGSATKSTSDRKRTKNKKK